MDTDDTEERSLRGHWRLAIDWQYNQTSPLIDSLDREIERMLNEDPDENEFPFDPDDANEVLDNYLGLGFVVLQGYVTSTSETLRKIRSKHGITTPPLKELLPVIGSTLSGTSLREMEAVCHIANFWKHRDQWDDAWTIVHANRFTIPALQSLGITHETTWPFQKAIELFTGENTFRLRPVLEKAEKWRMTCLLEYPGPTYKP